MPDLYDILTSVANGHAFDKHSAEFDNVDGRFGSRIPVNSQADLAEVLRDVINDPNTQAYYDVDNKTMMIANSERNVVIQLNNSVLNGDAGTVYRRPEGGPSATQKLNESSRIAESEGLLRAQSGSGSGAIVRSESPTDVRAMIERFASDNAAGFQNRPGAATNRSSANPQGLSTSQRINANQQAADALRASDPAALSKSQTQAALEGLDARIQSKGAQVQQGIEERAQAARVDSEVRRNAGAVYSDLDTTFKNGAVVEGYADGVVTLSDKETGAIYEIEFAGDGKSATIASLTDEGGEAVGTINSASRLNHIRKTVTELEFDRVVEGANLGDGVKNLSAAQVRDLQAQSELLSDASWTTKTNGGVLKWIDDAARKGIAFTAVAAALTFGSPSDTNAQALELPDPAARVEAVTPTRPVIEGVPIELNIPAVEEPPLVPEGTGAIEDVAGKADDAAKAAEAAKSADAAASAAEAASRARVASNAMDGGRALKAGGKLSIAGTVATTAAVGGIIRYAFSEQRGAAEAYRDAGMFSDDPQKNQDIYDEYIELNESIEENMQAENIAGQGWLFLATTPAVEYDARQQFSEFSARNNLSEDVHQALGMSMFDGQSLRGEFAENAADLIPENMSDFPPELHGLWRAKQEMDDAQSAFDRAERAGGGTTARRESRMSVEERTERQEARAENRQEATADLSSAQLAYQREFSRAFSNPETAQYLLDQMPPETLVDMVEATAQYNKDSAPPLIREMVEVQKQVDDGDSSIFYDTDAENRLEEIQAELKANPQIAHGYIADVFGGRVDPNTIPDAPAAAVDAGAVASFNAMPEYMQNRVIETAARNVDLQGDMAGVHPYMKDMAELYQARDRGGLRREASNRNSSNARIDEIENEVRSNPEIIGSVAASDPEVQALIAEYNENPEAAEQFSQIEETEINDVLSHIKTDAQQNGASALDDENALIRQVARLYDQRDDERRGRAAGFQNKNIDAKIRQVEEELRENPDIVSAYSERNMGDDLLPDDAPADPTAGDAGSVDSKPTPNDVIDRSNEIDRILPEGSNLNVQSSEGDAEVARGAVPDAQVSVTQGDNDPVPLTDLDRQRQEAEQAAQREEELRRQQQNLYGVPPGQPAAQQPGQTQ